MRLFRKKPPEPTYIPAPHKPTVRIVGVGSHARDIARIVERLDCEARFVPDSEVGGVFLGMNDPQTRARLAPENWCGYSCGLSYHSLTDPNAVVTGSSVGFGSVVGPFALVQDATLGRHVHVNYGAQMTRTRIGDFTTIAPGVTICGDVTIGARCLIGAGATISNLVTIGSDVTVGAGAVVIDDVSDGQTVVGVPARPIK